MSNQRHTACERCLGTGKNLIHPQHCVTCQGTGREPKPVDATISDERDCLESQEFYEVCQQYRHAPDYVVPDRPTASEAFEILKTWLRSKRVL